MKITKKVTVVGNSLGVLLNKSIIKKMGLKKGDWIQLDLRVVK